MTEDSTLYDRLGERDAIGAVVDRFYERVLADEALAPYFEDVDVDELRDHQTAFLSAVAGGPDEYSGDDMATAHAGLAITDDDFDAVADHLGATLEEFEVAAADRRAVLEAVESYREDVVTA